MSKEELAVEKMHWNCDYFSGSIYRRYLANYEWLADMDEEQFHIFQQLVTLSEQQ